MRFYKKNKILQSKAKISKENTTYINTKTQKVLHLDGYKTKHSLESTEIHKNLSSPVVINKNIVSQEPKADKIFTRLGLIKQKANKKSLQPSGYNKKIILQR